MFDLSMIAVSLATALSPSALDEPAVSETCALVVAKDGEQAVVDTPDLRALDPSSLSLPPGVDDLQLVVCSRSEFVVGDHDHLVLKEFKVPLYLAFGETVIALESLKGHLRVRLIQGSLTEEQKAILQVALDRNQAISQGDAP